MWGGEDFSLSNWQSSVLWLLLATADKFRGQIKTENRIGMWGGGTSHAHAWSNPWVISLPLTKNASMTTATSLEHQYHRPDFSAEYGVMDLQWQKSWEISPMEVSVWLLECKLAWLLLLLQDNFQKV
ncbi:hypothetical protein Q9233_003143 [Columba guinea]|nr:hypothetical protein Q9233_003143 [Columba guinea]